MSRELSVYRLARYSLVGVIGMVLTTGIAQAATFQVTSTADSGAGSLRQAIEDANSAVGADTIDFSPIDGNTITLDASLPEIVDHLSLQGSNVTVDGAGQYSCLAAMTADLSVDAMTITQCVGQFRNAIADNGIQSIEHQGGAIRVELGDLTLSNTVVSNNAAPADTTTEQFSLEGGGVFVSQAETVSITNSIFQNNTADEGAGGIHIDIAAQNIAITDSQITGNISGGAQGGARLNAADGDILLNNITVSNNEGMTGAGGLGVESLNGAIDFSDSLINGNRSVEAAGGASLYTGHLGDIVLTNVEISNNESDEGDGGLIAEADGNEGGSGSVVVTDSAIINNTAIGAFEACPAGGGTLLSRYDAVEVNNTIISGNVGQGWAFGGLAVSAYLGASVVQSTVTGNDSEEGGGGLISLGGLSLSDSTITDNSGAGGGLMHFDFTYASSTASLVIANSTLSGNSASSPGGGAFLYSYDGEMALESSTFSGNSADTGGGLAVTAAGTAQVELEGVTMTDNHATVGRGGGLFVTLDDPGIIGVNASILSGNSAIGGGADLATGSESANVTFDVSVSLIGDAPDDGSGFDPDTSTTNLLGVDPQLGALADNGGPTLTHLPAPGSPALNVVTNADGCGSTYVMDQRGRTRPDADGGLCDAGSVERQGAPQIAAAPDIDFGDIVVLDVAPVANAILENVGVEPLEITAFNGPNAPFTLDFSDCSDGLPLTLLPGQSCGVNFGFLPTTSGTFNETVAIESNSDSGDNEIVLSGRGTAPELSIADLDFGDQPVGTATERAITLTNSGEADLLISDLALSGDAVFELLADDCANPVAPGADCNVDIRFTPDAAVGFSATLAVTSNATEVPVDVSISGQGIVGKLIVNPSGGIDFGDVTVGTTGEGEITLSNDGDAPIEISGWSDPDAPFAMLGGNCPATPFSLQASESCTLTLGFSPEIYGDYEQVLNFVVDDGSGSTSMALSFSGRGMAPILPVPTLDRIGLVFGSGLLALLGLLGLRRSRTDRRTNFL